MNAQLQKLKAFWDARQYNERLLVLAALLAVAAFIWLELAHDRLAQARQQQQRQLTTLNAQIAQSQARIAELSAAFEADPNAMARQRLRELQAEEREADSRLDQLYGQLMTPQEMSSTLVSMLQRETALRLQRLENVMPTVMFESSGPTGPARQEALKVYRHGVTIEMRGSYLETLQYLRGLEALNARFFWDVLRLNTTEYPETAIVLSIFTLSTDETWIGG